MCALAGMVCGLGSSRLYALAHASFQGLGGSAPTVGSGQNVQSYAWAISADGSTIGGFESSTSAPFAGTMALGQFNYFLLVQTELVYTDMRKMCR